MFTCVSSGCVAVWGHSRGKTPVAGFQRQTPAWEGALAFHPDQTQPSESIFCLQLPHLLELPAKLGFIPFFFFLFPPLPLRTPGLFPFLEGALKSWNSLLILTLACNCFACARRIVEGTHPLTPNLNETARKVASQPPTHPMSAEARGPHIQIRFKKRKMEGEGY